MIQNAPLFVAYCPDGSYTRAGGVGKTPNRDRLLAALPDLAFAGFCNVATISYPGVWRDAKTASDYFAPLNAVARECGMHLIPGLWLHNIVETLHGGDARGRHAEKPRALKTIAFREQLLEVCDVLMQATPRAGAIYIDGEHCFWDTRASVFWTETNAAAVADMFERLADWCGHRQMHALLYQPDPAGTNQIARIARLTLGSIAGAAHVGTVLRLLVPQPYVVSASYRLPSLAQIQQRLSLADIPQRMARLGFISPHAAGGFSPRQFRDWLVTNNRSAASAWYVCNHLRLATIARQFADLVAQEVHLP